DRGELVAHLLDAGGELARAAQIHDLAGLSEPAGNRRIGLDHGADVGGNAFAQRHRHSARPVHADQTVQSEIWVACFGDGWSVRRRFRPASGWTPPGPYPPPPEPADAGSRRMT